MKKKTILIVEDILNVSVDIRHLLDAMGYTVMKIVTSGTEALKAMEEKIPDLVLTDVHLDGDMTGIETATLAQELYGVPVLFMASEVVPSFVAAMVASEAFGLVVKPFKPEVLKASVELALHKSDPALPTGARAADDCLFVRADYRYNRIDFEKIIYVEALKDYVVIHHTGGMVTTHSTIKGIENMLPDNAFVRIHRSYIVRIDKIHSIRYPELMVEGKMKILPVGGLYKKRLFNRINTLQ